MPSNPSSTSSTCIVDAAEQKKQNQENFKLHCRGLNQSFQGQIQKSLQKNASRDLSKLFDQYKSHLDSIRKKFPFDDDYEVSFKMPPSTPKFDFVKNDDSAPNSESKPTADNLFVSGKNSQNNANYGGVATEATSLSNSVPFTFHAEKSEGNGTVNKPAFTFVTAEQKEETKSAFSFGTETKAANGEKPAFSFGSEEKPASSSVPESKPASSSLPESKAASSVAFSFGSEKPSLSTEKKDETSDKPVFSFSFSEKKEESNEKPVFSFGSDANEKPSFSFGSTEKDEKASFSLGTSNGNSSFSFGSAAEASEKPAFSFGVTDKKGNEKPAFSFGVTEKNDDKPVFSFGSTEMKDNEKPSFSLGVTKKKDDEKPVFSFGVTEKNDGKPAFSFGSTEKKDDEKPVFSFGSSNEKPLFSFGSASNDKPVFSFGGNAPTFSGFALPSKQEENEAAEGDDDEEESAPVLESALVQTRAGEEDEETIYSSRAKLFLLTLDKGWKDLGIGQCKVNENKLKKDQKRILMRSEAGKVMLNVSLSGSTEVCYDVGKKEVTLLAPSEDLKLNKWMIRVKTAEDAAKMYQQAKRMD